MISKLNEFQKREIPIIEGNYIIGISTINVINDKNLIHVIIEADGNCNPTDYSELIFNAVKDIIGLNNLDRIYLDLSDLYGIKSKYWLYKWVWKINENKLYDEEFIPIVEDNYEIDEIEYNVLRKYIYYKFKTNLN